MSGLAPELEKLLVLQEREQRQMRLGKELAAWPNEVKALEQRRAEVRAGAEKKRLEAQNAEVERKKLELEAESHRAKAARYKLQQFETRKNEEFTALGTEILREEKEVQEIHPTSFCLFQTVPQRLSLGRNDRVQHLCPRTSHADLALNGR